MKRIIPLYLALLALAGVQMLSSCAYSPLSVPEFTAQTGYRSRTFDSSREYDVRQTVLRIAFFSGEVSFSPAEDPEEWQLAFLNYPVTLGDHLYTARNSRLELQAEGTAIYLGPETAFSALNLNDEVKQFSLGVGVASFRVTRLDSGESYEVDTPNAAVTIDRPGEYRIDVDYDGNTNVYVTRGYAYVAAAGGEVPLEAGNLMVIDGIDYPVYDLMRLPHRDSWDQWVDSRSRFPQRNYGHKYVSPNIFGVDDLDAYGRWSNVPGYGTCWSPSDTSSDWQPYRAGRWIWQNPWGWSWVSTEPWGWAPYHYGSWVRSHSRWYWVPVGPKVRMVRYSPARVVFVGDERFSLSISLGGRQRTPDDWRLGWFPLGPREHFVPWWGSGSDRAYPVQVKHQNRAYVTVVKRNAFVSGELVRRNMIRDERSVRELTTAPLITKPKQLLTRSDQDRGRVINRERTSIRPSTLVMKRAVVNRLPVAERVVRPTRSVLAQEGHIKLKPKNGRVAGPRPKLVTRESKPGKKTHKVVPKKKDKKK